MKTRNLVIYALTAVVSLVLISRLVTVALLIAYAPEDAQPYFYLKQMLISIVCVAAIIWLWRKRIQPKRPGVES